MAHATWKKVVYCVGILEYDNTLKFVTSYESYPHKIAYWTAGEKAFTFESKYAAEQLQMGLCVNGYRALVISVPPDVMFFANPSAPEEEPKDEDVSEDDGQ